MFKTVYDMKINDANISRISSANLMGKQSPKILSGKYRPNFNAFEGNEVGRDMKAQFSLLDMPIGIISRGTKVPKQYDRNEMDRLYNTFNKTSTSGFFNKKIEPKIEEKEHNETREIPKEIIEDYNLKNEKKDEEQLNQENQEIIIKQTESQQNTKIEMKECEEKNKNIVHERVIYPYERNIKTASVSSDHRMKKISADQNIEKIATKSNYTSNVDDKWMPKYIKEQERLIKTAHAPRADNISNNSNKLQPQMPVVSVKEIKMKMYESDIFFSRQPSSENKHLVKLNNYQTSDIHMKKNDSVNLKKNGEVYLLKNKTSLYNTAFRSNSEWHPKNSYPTLLNHCSTDYHILNPGIKHISKTRKDIDGGKEFNPVLRQKSLCEFIDLTRVGVPNPNKEYLNAFKKNPKCFARESNICSAYLDIHGKYVGLCDKPFVKF